MLHRPKLPDTVNLELFTFASSPKFVTSGANENNYKTLLEKYKLIPEETIFIDDKKCNVEVANNFGIHGIRFTVLDKLKKELEQYI